MLDLLHNDVEYRQALSPVSEGGNSAHVSSIIDTAQFNALEFIIAWGSLADTDATFTVLVEDGDVSNLSDAAAVDDAYLLGTEVGAAALFSNDDTVSKIGYIGKKRYVRLTITPAANSSAALISVVAALTGARKLPRSTQLA